MVPFITLDYAGFRYYSGRKSGRKDSPLMFGLSFSLCFPLMKVIYLWTSFFFGRAPWEKKLWLFWTQAVNKADGQNNNKTTRAGPVAAGSVNTQTDPKQHPLGQRDEIREKKRELIKQLFSQLLVTVEPDGEPGGKVFPVAHMTHTWNGSKP